MQAIHIESDSQRSKIDKGLKYPLEHHRNFFKKSCVNHSLASQPSRKYWAIKYFIFKLSKLVVKISELLRMKY